MYSVSTYTDAFILFIEHNDSNAQDFELKDIAELAARSELGFDVFAYIKTLYFKLRKWAIKNFITLMQERC